MAVRRDVEVPLQDLLLGELLLQGQRVLHLPQLAGGRLRGRVHNLLRGARRVRDGLPHVLHRERRGALRDAVGLLVGHERAGHALHVHAVVFVEPGVLGRDDRLLHDRRDVVDGHVAAVLVPEHREQRFVVTRVDVGDLRRWYQFELGRKAVERVGARLGGEAGDRYGREGGCRHDEARQ